jgi:hypothetical protein
MRLTLAAALLAESSFTIASSSLYDDVLKKAGLLLSNVEPSGGERGRRLSRVPAILSGFHGDGAYNEDNPSQLKDFPDNLLELPSTKNTQKNRRLYTSQLTECDPNISADLSVPDLGILSSCGPGQYCVESVESALGGYCSESLGEDNHRHLQATTTIIDSLSSLCSGDSTNPYLECATCGVDSTTYTASVDCIIPSYCTSVPSFCTPGNVYDFCGGYTYKLKVTAPGIRAGQVCQSFETPIQFEYCLDKNYNIDTTSCAMSINGVTCTSCEIYLDSLNQQNCELFDCGNTDLPFSGSSCDSDFMYRVAIAYMYAATLPCDGGCNLCGEGGSMLYGDNYFTLLNAETIPLNCFESQFGALLGTYPTVYCTTAFYEAAQGPCGCVASAPVAGAAPIPAPVAVGTPTPVAVGTVTPVAVPGAVGTVTPVAVPGAVGTVNPVAVTPGVSSGPTTARATSTMVGLLGITTAIAIMSGCLVSWA